uniref:Uncharacterized protein n=1 Tax=Arundo donax TaxID=35708 RepID=A0A0A9C2I5_ARUDO
MLDTVDVRGDGGDVKDSELHHLAPISSSFWMKQSNSSRNLAICSSDMAACSSSVVSAEGVRNGSDTKC